jgi:hypothetical protein
MMGKSQVIRCGCNQKVVSGKNRDLAARDKHVCTTKKHLAYIKDLHLNLQKEARLATIATEDLTQEPGVVRMELDGTHRSYVMTEDNASTNE